MKKELLKVFLAGGLVVGLWVMGFPYLGVVLAGVVAYVGLHFLLEGGAEQNEKEHLEHRVNEVIENVEKKLRLIQREVSTLSLREAEYGNEINSVISEITSVARDITKDVHERPEKLEQVQAYLMHYLESTSKILKTYNELKGKRSSEVEGLKDKFKNILMKLLTSFKAKKRNLLEDQITELDTEIAVLDTMLEIE